MPENRDTGELLCMERRAVQIDMAFFSRVSFAACVSLHSAISATFSSRSRAGNAMAYAGTAAALPRLGVAAKLGHNLQSDQDERYKKGWLKCWALVNDNF